MATLRSQIIAARQRCRTGTGGSVLDHLCSATGMSAVELAPSLQAEGGVGVLLDDDQPRPDFTVLEPQRARAWRCALIAPAADGTPRVAMADPWDDDPVRHVAALIGRLPQPVAASGAWLERWLSAESAAPPARQRTELDPADGGPVVEFVQAAMLAAYAAGASDVHFECDRQGVTTKLRHDGVMQMHSRMEGHDRAEQVISRIKVLAQLDITERRMPQDGRFRLAMSEGEAVDLRVSIMPSVFGEDAVLRLLDKAQLRGASGLVTLDALGFDAASIAGLRQLAQLPHGMIMVTGPTGSGKTTTVYALLSEMNTGLEKIITIEDPVEYELGGVLQIPVNERKGLTFAKGLRSILRHDPDRILVGEIRDAETAEIAIQSALTGHQVLTTVHANSLFDVTGRFRHFGLDMFGFMAALCGVVVQRLVRVVCPSCATKRSPTQQELQWLSGHGCLTDEVVLASGCASCRGTGYRGRTVLAEIHRIDDGFRDLVIAGRPMGELRRHVEGTGVVALGEAAARAVRDGLTTPEEVRRVVGA